MSVHVEWLSAGYCQITIAEPGEEVGENAVDDDKFGLVMSGDDVMVIEGSLAGLESVVKRMLAAVLEARANQCEGHESLAGEHMGESVRCDGTCKS